MSKDRCPTCAGPVEMVPCTACDGSGNVGWGTCSTCKGVSDVLRALPDTLEGIEAEAQEQWTANQDYDTRSRTEGQATELRLRSRRARAAVFERTVYRLFNGCATCGREPRLDKMVADKACIEHERQAYQQAAEMAEAAVYPNNDDRDELIKLGRKLRKLAEGE
jgi:hypothetical protein